ncbi:MAG: GDP-mannose 4,6-dehydratase [Thermoguttaceae bacterium]|nr:GDP-mannose 4,6-dehydratase [Thermoguttaceae bacterium]
MGADDEMTKYLITGGAGFVGSHLAERLLDEGHSVTVLDDLSTGRWENIGPLADDRRFKDRFQAVIASADDEALLERLVPPVDFVFHLASAVGVKLIVDDPVGAVQRIVRPTERIADACARYRKPILLTSTSEVYGKSDKIPFREDENVVIGPTCKHRWAYAVAKMLDEFYLLAHYKRSSLPVRIVRLFNTVGPRQTGQYGMVLPRFVDAALAGEPLLVCGDGKQMRCFTSVRDVVRGLIDVSRCPAAVGKVINLGSDEEISIAELAERVVKMTGSSSPIRYISYEEAYGPNFDDMRRRVPCLDRAKELIGWRRDDTLDDVIGQVIDCRRNAQKTE